MCWCAVKKLLTHSLRTWLYIKHQCGFYKAVWLYKLHRNVCSAWAGSAQAPWRVYEGGQKKGGLKEGEVAWTGTPRFMTDRRHAVCTGDPFVSHVQASGVFFHWVCHPYCVVQFWLWPLRLLLCPSRKCPRCCFAICDEQRSVLSLVLLLEALYRRVDRIIVLYNLIFTFRLIHLYFHIFLIFPNELTVVAFPIRILMSLQSRLDYSLVV